jgi:siroheme synthase-like protein
LVFVATDDGAVTAEVASEGRRGGVWVNAADDPEHCDFILPSVLRRDTLTVAVSTGGTSPALARAIREELETYFTDAYRVLARLAGEARRELRESGATADADAWRRALDPALRRLIAEGREGEARARLLGRLRAGACA